MVQIFPDKAAAGLIRVKQARITEEYVCFDNNRAAASSAAVKSGPAFPILSLRGVAGPDRQEFRGMNRLKIPHDAFVFVGDGRKAIFLRNEGNEKFPNLKTEQVFEDDNPPTHEQGTDRPGHLGKAMGSGRRSAVEPADWHDLNEHRFAKTVAGAMEQVMRERKAPALVIVAPPRTLADVRDALHADVAALVIAEVNKNLTRHPVGEIEKLLTGG
jgi:protein required for attachment to host cells